MSQTSFTVTKQMMVANNVGSANPGDLHIPIGRWESGTGLAWNGRATLYAPVNFSGMTTINYARLYLKAHWVAGWHAHGTSTATLNVYRKTTDWSETSHGGSSAVDELWGGDGTAVTNTGWTATGVGQGSFGNLTEGAWYYIDITDIVQAWKSGSANYGVLITNGTSETNDAYGKEFYSRHTSSDPYILIDYSSNSTPNAPVNLSPTGDQIVNSGTSFTASGTRSDPDTGDYITAYRIVVYKDDGTTEVADTGTVTTSGTPTTFSRSMSVGGYGANKFYKWIARTRDQAGVWGPFSAQQRCKLNTVPNTPTLNAVDTTDLTPNLSGSASDPDSGDGMTQVQIEVVRVSDSVTMWSSGDLAATGSTWSKTYSGSALSWAVQYKFRARIKDGNGAYSAWSAYTYWTTTQPVGPTQSPKSVRLTDTTPDLTISYNENFTDHDIYLYSDINGSNLVWSSSPAAYGATTSKVVTVGTTLTDGATYYWKARIYVQSTSTWTDYAGVGQNGKLETWIYMNALPTAPTGLSARNDASSPVVIRDSDGVHIVTTTTPLLEAVYNDPDLGSYGDYPSARAIEIYNDSTGASVHSNENLAPSYTLPMAYTVPGSTLSYETTYKVRWRFQDTSDTYGAWSDYLRFKVTQVSSMSSLTPSGTITSPNFTAAWSHSSPSGKSQGRYHVMIKDSSDVVVYDTYWVYSSTESHAVAGAGVLINGQSYSLIVEAYDSDGV